MTAKTKMSDYLGGPMVLGPAAESPVALALAIPRGLSAASLDSVIMRLDGAVPLRAILEVIGTVRSMQRKRRLHLSLSRGESDRLARVARIAALACDALGSVDRGHRWLAEPNAALGGATPAELLVTDPGTTLVQDALAIESAVSAVRQVNTSVAGELI